jgi:hypothetical protein
VAPSMGGDEQTILRKKFSWKHYPEVRWSSCRLVCLFGLCPLTYLVVVVNLPAGTVPY